MIPSSPQNNPPRPVYDVIIVGGSAAGLVCAIAASLRNKSVLLLEKSAQWGNKILISGGGRCNFTNLHMGPEHYYSKQPLFCKPALKNFTQHDFLTWVKQAQIAYFEKEKGQLFCKSSSKLILQMLLQKLKSNCVTLKPNTNVSHCHKNPETGFFEISAQNKVYLARHLVIATGGLSYPQLGACAFGFETAKKFGHNITPTQPALVGLLWPEKEKRFFAALTGNALPVKIKIKKKIFCDSLLFTHAGISGPVVLNASLFWEHKEPLLLDFLPDISDFQNWFHKIRQEETKKQLFTIMSQFLPKKIAQALCAYAQVDDCALSVMAKSGVRKLEQVFKTFSFVPPKTMGYKTAEVTRGGIATDSINPKTMESRLCQGLFFAGEVLDVTGSLGGYNLQWAWSSGWLAGQNI